MDLGDDRGRGDDGKVPICLVAGVDGAGLDAGPVRHASPEPTGIRIARVDVRARRPGASDEPPEGAGLELVQPAPTDERIDRRGKELDPFPTSERLEAREQLGPPRGGQQLRIPDPETDQAGQIGFPCQKAADDERTQDAPTSGLIDPEQPGIQ